jgi:hypothetical protein
MVRVMMILVATAGRGLRTSFFAATLLRASNLRVLKQASELPHPEGCGFLALNCSNVYSSLSYCTFVA